MAKLPPSSILHGASGKIGGVIFRQVGGKTIVQSYTEPSTERSELQTVYNNKMREAASQAKAALLNPAVKAHYEKKKKKLKASSAYTAACIDFLRNGRIDKVSSPGAGSKPKKAAKKTGAKHKNTKKKRAMHKQSPR